MTNMHYKSMYIYIYNYKQKQMIREYGRILPYHRINQIYLRLHLRRLGLQISSLMLVQHVEDHGFGSPLFYHKKTKAIYLKRCVLNSRETKVDLHHRKLENAVFVCLLASWFVKVSHLQHRQARNLQHSYLDPLNAEMSRLHSTYLLH